ncbi:hypothetical protein ACJX0J_007801, partial [Zea mays]
MHIQIVNKSFANNKDNMLIIKLNLHVHFFLQVATCCKEINMFEQHYQIDTCHKSSSDKKP